jgi:hypothetical protein
MLAGVGAAAEQLRGLVPKALAVLERALDDPEQGAKVALAVLRAVGLWGLKPVKEPDLLAYHLHSELKIELESLLDSKAER